MKQSRMQLLQRIYDHDRTEGGSLQINADRSDNSCDALTLDTDVSYLKRNGYIIEELDILHSYYLSLTEKGERFVENGFQSPQSVQSSSFNFAGATINNAVIGNDATNNSFIMNVGASIADLKELIESKPIEDQEALQEMLHELQRLQNTNEPLQRNLLARFSDLIKKHTDLIIPLGQALIGLCTGAGQ